MPGPALLHECATTNMIQSLQELLRETNYPLNFEVDLAKGAVRTRELQRNGQGKQSKSVHKALLPAGSYPIVAWLVGMELGSKFAEQHGEGGVNGMEPEHFASHNWTE
ncbi:hypothetical protein PABG_11097 [Paracoccidioides brasiliensis Pb03]|nr:hypothetical protein PABG_11097 [Paracoccidioides brasiliensis Pb03]